MNYLITKLIEHKVFFIIKILSIYVNIERMYYCPKNKFTYGDKIKYNWKYLVYFKECQNNPQYYTSKRFTFDNIDEHDYIVETIENEIINLYWICAAKK